MPKTSGVSFVLMPLGIITLSRQERENIKVYPFRPLSPKLWLKEAIRSENASNTDASSTEADIIPRLREYSAEKQILKPVKPAALNIGRTISPKSPNNHSEPVNFQVKWLS